MGKGKTIKYPKRQKYRPLRKGTDNTSEPVSEEEHKKRLELLKQMGLIK